MTICLDPVEFAVTEWVFGFHVVLKRCQSYDDEWVLRVHIVCFLVYRIDFLLWYCFSETTCWRQVKLPGRSVLVIQVYRSFHWILDTTLRLSLSQMWTDLGLILDIQLIKENALPAVLSAPVNLSPTQGPYYVVTVWLCFLFYLVQVQGLLATCRKS